MKLFAAAILLAITVLLPIEGTTQNLSNNGLEEKYETYFQHPRESVHLHLNKTLFLTGEEIWWSGYVYNKRTNTPSFETTNLYCGIYDQNGEQIHKGLFLVDGGRVHGSFKVGSELASGSYFIKAGTLWMKNFREDSDFVQKIVIINQNLEFERASATTYDLQILPEGGHLIEEVNNSVGIRLTDQNGKGVQVRSAVVLDKANTPVRHFSNNRYGVGKFDLAYKRGQTYKLRISLDDGAILEQELPKAKRKGISLSVNNILDDKMIISLETNALTLSDIEKEPFYLAIHRDGLMVLNPLRFRGTTKTVHIPKNKLLSGVNIITLFNKNLQPLSERLAFNYADTRVAKVKLNRLKKKIKDSIFLRINVLSKSGTPASLSVTALPSETIANVPQNDIVSNFLLQPYLKSRVENPGRYFRNVSRKKAYELDLILLTQGWSSYDWKTIFEGAPMIEHPFERGIKAEGKITSKIKKEDLLVVHQGTVNPLSFVELTEPPNFSLPHLLLQNQDTIRFALRSKRGALRKLDLDIDFKSRLSIKDSIPFDLRNTPSLNRIKTAPLEDKINIANNFVTNEVIRLDEVVVTEQKIEKKLTKASTLVNSNFFKGFKIGEDELRRNAVLTDFIAKNGFRVNVNTLTGQVFIANTRPFSGPVAIYLDDFLVRDGADLFNIPMDRIDEIYIERDGLSGDSDASGGAIRIYTKNGQVRTSFTPRFAEKLVINSFERPKTFYKPKYGSYVDQNFKDFGIVHWEPQLITDESGTATMGFPSNTTSNITVFLEGMGTDGTLISHAEEILQD